MKDERVIIYMGKILVINEKPSQAMSFVEALKKEGSFSRQNGYFESDKYIVTFSIGHILRSKQPADYKEFGGWKWDAIPFFPPNGEMDYISDQRTAAQLKVIGDLLKRSDVDLVVNAADAGREGELIFWEIFDHFKSKHPVKRIWISTLVAKDILNGFQNLKEEAFFLPKREAAYSRQYADWTLGMNLTVGFSIKANMGRALHVGRVQTPTIALLVDRKQEIVQFKPEHYFEIEAEFGDKYKGKWFQDQLGNTRLNKEEDAQKIVATITGKTGTVVKKDVEEEKENPKTLYNLSDLQRDANKKFGFTATKTLAVAQLLYEKYTVLSYPRTSSRHLGEVQIPDLKPTLEAIRIGDYAKFVDDILARGIKTSKRFVNDKEVSDHHAIIPTKMTPDFSQFVDEPKDSVTKGDLMKMYDLVTKRFLAVFYLPAVYEKTQIVTEVEGETFKTSGKILVSAGWKEVYGSEVEEEDEDDAPKKGKKEKIKVVKLPPIAKDEENVVNNAEKQPKATKSQSHYTEGDLIEIMENPRKLLEDDELKEIMKAAGAGLGTEATRAGIIENIISRGYVERKGKTLIATELAEKLISIAPIELKSPEVTAEWEQKLMDMEKSKVNRADFEEEIRNYVTKNLRDLEQSELEISFGHVSDGAVVGTCPTCKNDVKEKNKVFACDTTDCFVVFKEMAKKKISEAQVKILLSKGETTVLKGFKSKAGKSFEAKLVMKDGKVAFGFADQLNEKTDMKCSLCQGTMVDKGNAVVCANGDLTIYKTIASKKISNKLVEQLLTKGESDLVTGFKSKTGKPFDAKLKLTGGKVEFAFDNKPKLETKDSGLSCPFCGGKVTDNAKAYGCSNWREKNCKFSVWKVMSGKTMTNEIIQELIEQKKTVKMDGFKNQSGKEFSASLVLNMEAKKVDLSFE